MWSATLALNGLTTAGIGAYAFPNHMMGHSLSALYDIAHGSTLSIVFPAWLKYNKDKLAQRLQRFGKEVFGVDNQTQAIEKLEDFFASIGAPTKLKDVGLSQSDIEAIAQNAVSLAQKWGLNEYTKDKIASILKFAL
jgi:hypothetical protein